MKVEEKRRKKAFIEAENSSAINNSTLTNSTLTSTSTSSVQQPHSYSHTNVSGEGQTPQFWDKNFKK